MAEYRNTGTPEFALTNKRLIPWLQRYAKPSEWVIELTGGEPALYPGIDELCEWLSEHGYCVLVKTNGLLPIRKFRGIKRVAAFHQLENPPKYFDEILIVDKIQRLEKEAVCRQNGWPYKVIGYNKENPDGARHGFSRCAYMDPHGHPLGCKSRKVRYTEWPDKYALEFTGLQTTMCCSGCKAAIDAWRFIDWKT